jgi:hypothetical protein
MYCKSDISPSLLQQREPALSEAKWDQGGEYMESSEWMHALVILKVINN